MNDDKASIPLLTLALPILIENLIRTSLMAVDQLMLYAYSERAAAAMSAVNQLAFFIQLLYMLVASGASILISQNLGAGRKTEAGRLALGSHLLIGIFGLVLSIVIALTANSIVALFGLDPEVRGYATTFLAIYGGGSVFMALNIVQANVLRAYGHPRDPMLINVAALIITIAGNYLSLFGPLGFPILGIAGVAFSNLIGQALAFVLGFFRIRSREEITMRWKDSSRVPISVMKSILAVGVPTAGENLAYNLAQILIVSFIASMGTESLAAYGLVLTLSRYVFIGGVSIGGAAQLKVGYLVGAGRFDEAQRKVYGYWFIGFVISLVLVTVMFLLRAPLIALFTTDAKIAGLASTVMVASLIFEPGRNFNTIVTPALKGSGDIRFPVLIALISMWGLGALGAYIFGIRLGLGLLGIWMGLALDEWTRGIVIMIRWRSGAWRGKALVAGSFSPGVEV
jgi:putative MATE family efflux protein